MGKTIITGIVAVVVGLGLATGVTYGVVAASSPDRGVNFDEAGNPNNSNSSDVDYGTP